MNQQAKIAELRDLCIHHLQNGTSYNRHIYYEHLPIHLIHTDFDVKITVRHIDWKADSSFELGVFKPGHRYTGTRYETYRESCKALLTVTIKTNIYFPIEIESDLYFDVMSYYNGANLIRAPYAHNNYSRDIDRFHEVLSRTQKRFQLETIADLWFDGKISFVFYTDIVRKPRQLQPANNKLGNSSYVDQLEQAHIEVATHISHAFSYIPFLDDLLGKKLLHEGDTLYLPNVNYYSYQFYTACEAAIDRLYTFWETLVVLPYNYESLNFTDKSFSFGRYFGKMIQKFSDNQPVKFSQQSPNLKWILDFYNGDYQEITHYRHRFVHHQFTPTHDGLLSAKYSINAYENIANKPELQKLNEEIKALPPLLIKHFKYCIDGFKHMLYLIDELP